MCSYFTRINKQQKILNDTCTPLWDNRNRYLFLWTCNISHENQKVWNFDMKPGCVLQRIPITLTKICVKGMSFFNTFRTTFHLHLTNLDHVLCWLKKALSVNKVSFKRRKYKPLTLIFRVKLFYLWDGCLHYTGPITDLGAISVWRHSHTSIRIL